MNLTGYSACLSVSTLYSEVWTIVLLWFTRTHSHKNAYMNHIQSVCVCVIDVFECKCHLTSGALESQLRFGPCLE